MHRPMRLRSSQIVFLLLIACSVQIREERALRWVEHAVSGNSVCSFALRETASQAAQPESPAGAGLLVPLGLAPADLSAQREPWTMRHPASDSTSVVACTGLFRA